MIHIGFEIEVESIDRNLPIRLDSIHDLIDKTTHITDWKSEYGILAYHQSSAYTNVGKWGVEFDSSLFNGVEFVTPVQEKNKGLRILEEFLSYIDEAKCYTSNSCGLHLNISANNMTVTDMDNSYFLSNINQKLLYALWGNRLKGTNVFCVPMKKILAFIRPLSILDTDIQKTILKGKYRYVNKRTSNGLERLEIRVMGGEDYHKKIKEIKKTTNMFCDLLEGSYEKSQPKSKKRIISYINRVQNKKPRNYNLWIPTINPIYSIGINSFFYLLNGIKVSLENTEHPENVSNVLERVFPNSYTIWEDYCFRLLSYLRSYIQVKNLNTVSIEKATQKINEIFYRIFKYLDKTNHNIPLRMFGLFLNGHTRIDNYKIILTVPKDEKATNVVWLCKHSEKLSEEAKKCFVNNLSLSALRFIKKKEIITMEDAINNREKQLIEEKGKPQ